MFIYFGLLFWLSQASTEPVLAGVFRELLTTPMLVFFSFLVFVAFPQLFKGGITLLTLLSILLLAAVGAGFIFVP